MPPRELKGKQKAEPDADVEDEAPAAKKPKGKQKAEPVRPTIAPEAVAKMSMGTLALASCLPHACAVCALTVCVCVQSPQASSRRR